MARVKREYVEEYGSSTFRVGDLAGISATLERALASLWVAYQPIVQAGDGTVFAHEALMRSEEPDLPNPQAVLKAAERVDRLQDLGGTMRRLTALDLAATEQSVFFVNLHPEDLVDEALYQHGSQLTRFAHRVVLEITERASLEHIGNVRDRVARLRALGFRIALDDLGAGYAGLTSFTQLEPEFVKLDMELIRGIHQNDMKRKIVRLHGRALPRHGQIDHRRGRRGPRRKAGTGGPRLRSAAGLPAGQAEQRHARSGSVQFAATRQITAPSCRTNLRQHRRTRPQRRTCTDQRPRRSCHRAQACCSDSPG